MPIIPDAKNWTWVLERACPECGFDSAQLEPSSVPAHLLRLGAAWSSVLSERDPDAVRARPSDDRWSPLEYGCHTRDVFRKFDERLRLMLEFHNPTFPNWDQDATAITDRYGEQDPALVAEEVKAAAAVLSRSFEALPAGSWQRTGTRSDGPAFTIESFARYLVHDPVHHLHDVGVDYHLKP